MRLPMPCFMAVVSGALPLVALLHAFRQFRQHFAENTAHLLPDLLQLVRKLPDFTQRIYCHRNLPGRLPVQLNSRISNEEKLEHVIGRSVSERKNVASL
jgi:hypothetical protein